MSLQHISTAIDREQPHLGDVVIVKHTVYDPKAPRQLMTVCTECGQKFPTQFRRMGRLGTRRACEVRNVPQCPKCRSKYAKKASPAQPELPLRAAGEFKVGDTVKVIDSWYHQLPVGGIHKVTRVYGGTFSNMPMVNVDGVTGGYLASRFTLVKAVTP